MSNTSSAQAPSDSDYQRAVDLLKAERGQEASAVLATILARDPDNERAWDLLSYAVADREKQIYALQRVVQINRHNVAAWARLVELGRGMIAPDPA